MSVTAKPTPWVWVGFTALGLGYLTSSIVLFAKYPSTTRVALTVQGVAGLTPFTTASSVFSFSLLYYLASVALVIAVVQLAVAFLFRLTMPGAIVDYGHGRFLGHDERDGSSASLKSKDDENGASGVGFVGTWVSGDVTWTDHTLNTSLATTRWISYATIAPLVAHLVGQPSIATFLLTSATLALFVSSAQLLRYAARATDASVSINPFKHASIVKESFHKVTAVFAVGLLLSYVMTVYVSFFTVVGSAMSRSTIPNYVIACVVMFGLDAGWVTLCALWDSLIVGYAMYPSGKTDIQASERARSHPSVAVAERTLHFVFVVSTLFLIAEQYGGASGTV